MFVNDLAGMCRGSIFGGEITPQIPAAIPTWGNIPYGCGLGTYNVAGQFFHPAYGYFINRIPQTFVPQGFAPQALGQVGPIAQNPFLSPYPMNVPIGNPILANAGLTANPLGYGYGFSPYTFSNWSIPQGFQGPVCR